MNEELKTVKAGTLLSIESGEYSDYQVHGFFVVLKDFEPMKIVDEYPIKETRYRDDYFNNMEFLTWLLQKGLLLEVDYSVFYLASYGRRSECSFRNHKPTQE